MAELATTRMSSKGQVVIPEEIRKRLGLGEWLNRRPGFEGRVEAFGAWDVLPYILNTGLIRKARQQAHKAGMKRSDIKKAVAEVRGRR